LEDLFNNPNPIGFSKQVVEQVHLQFGSMALCAGTPENVTLKPEWARSGWRDGAHDFWNDFINDGRWRILRHGHRTCPYPEKLFRGAASSSAPAAKG
jgi:hypothetical protein